MVRFPIAAFAAALPDESARVSFAVYALRSQPERLLSYVLNHPPEDWRRKRKSARL